jgi:hypothetical protein
MISPNVVSIHTPDPSNPENILRSIITPGMNNPEKALAIYDYCWHNTWHWPAPKEGRQETHELDVVYDVNKQLNVYGYSYCFAIRALAEALYEAAGFEARSGGIGGHVVTEVYYDGKYHYLDHDQRGYCRLDDGTIAELADFRTGRARKLILDPDSPPEPFFPATRLPLVPYEQKHVFTGYLLNQHIHYRQHDKYRTTHSMNLTLRPGERFTRYWNATGRWHVPNDLVPEIRGNGYVDLWAGPFEHTAKNYQEARRLDDGGPMHYSNGLSIYRPNLSVGSEDFDSGVYRVDNINSTGTGFGPLRTDAPAVAIFRTRLPYVIVGWPGNFDERSCKTGGCVVSGTYRKTNKTDTLSIEVSRDGSTWNHVWLASVLGEANFAIDISPHVIGFYSYYIRFSFESGTKPEDLAILAFEIDTACQLNPAVLPRIRPGYNAMTVTNNPGSNVFEEHIQYGDLQDHNRMCVLLDNLVTHQNASYTMLSPKEPDETGHVVYELKSPPGSTIVWGKGGGAFRSHQDVAMAPDEQYRVYFAEETPDEWELIWEADRPPYLQHWCFEANFEIPLDKPAGVIYLKYELTRGAAGAEGGGMIGARMAWGCERLKTADSTNEITVTQIWKSDGVEKRKQVVTSMIPYEYQFEASGAVVENIAISVEPADRGPDVDAPHPLLNESPSVTGREIADHNAVPAMRKALAKLDLDPSAETVADIMNHNPHEWTRNAIVAAFMAVGGMASAEALLDAIGEREWAEDCYLELLSFEGDVAQLTERLSMANSMDRIRICELLELKGDATAAPALLSALAVENDPVALAAEIAAYIQVSDPFPTDNVSLSDITGILKKLDFRESIRVASRLARKEIDQGIVLLESALSSDNQYFRYEAVVAIVRSGHADAAELLIRALSDVSHWVRREAISGLRCIGGDKALAALLKSRRVEKERDLQIENESAIAFIQKRAGNE